MEAMMREISEQNKVTERPDGSTSCSSSKSSDGYVTTDEPISSSDSGVCYSSEDDDSSSEDMQERIEFIRQKQRLMKRAASVLLGQEQEAYEAATARSASQVVGTQDKPDSIWTRAKRVLPKQSAAKKALARRNLRGSNRGGKRTIQPSPVDPSINLANVNQVESEAFDRSTAIEEDENDAVERLPEVSFPQGQWMAQALIRSSSTDLPSNPSDCRWKVIADPVTCSLGLVPPSSFSMEHGISIEDALKLSDEGHLLTQATPPFCVVHVNKAFLVLARLSSAASLIGRPVESVLQATQDMTTFPALNSPYGQQEEAKDFVWARFLRHHIVASDDDAGEEQDESYQMRVTPVLDRSQRRRLSSATEASPPLKGYTCLSHVLVRMRKVAQGLQDVGPATLEEEESTIMQVSETDTKNSDDTGQSSVSGNSYTLGTIG
jgi:hypothetical protein